MKTLSEDINHSPNVALARHLATTLKDPASVAYYLTLAQSYPHQLLLELLEAVMEIPSEKIVTRRAAIFVANVKRYDPKQ